MRAVRRPRDRGSFEARSPVPVPTPRKRLHRGLARRLVGRDSFRSTVTPALRELTESALKLLRLIRRKWSARLQQPSEYTRLGRPLPLALRAPRESWSSLHPEQRA